MKILIAEDDALVLKTMEMCLKKAGYEVIACLDGMETMKNIEVNDPDIIIVDIMLPYLSGLEIVGKVKQSGNPVPVIVISALGQQEVVEEAIKLGAVDFISKPFNINILKVLIKEHTSTAAIA